MFVAPGGRPYDLAPDGRFLIIRSGEAEAGSGTAPQIVVVQNRPLGKPVRWHKTEAVAVT
jgi:hypothetical protein